MKIQELMKDGFPILDKSENTSLNTVLLVKFVLLGATELEALSFTF